VTSKNIIQPTVCKNMIRLIGW